MITIPVRYGRSVFHGEDSASFENDVARKDCRRDRYNASRILHCEYTRRVGWTMQGRRQIVTFALSMNQLMTGWVGRTFRPDHEGEGKRKASFDRCEVDIGHGFSIYLCLCGVLTCIPPLFNMHRLSKRAIRFPTRSRQARSPLVGPAPQFWWGVESERVMVYSCDGGTNRPARLSLKTPAQPFDTLPIFLTKHKTHATPIHSLLTRHRLLYTHSPTQQHTQHRQYGQSRCGVPNKHLHTHPVTAC